MQTLEGIRQQIQTSERLHGVVRTMKLLSLTSIRQCEEAVDSLADYDRTVQMGLQIALRRRPRGSQRSVIEAAPDHRPAGAIVFGSTWGMCGRFNEDLAAFASEKLDGLDGGRVRVWALGDYVAGPLQRAGWPPDETAPNPESVEGITRRVQDLLVRIDRWRERHAIGRLALYYNEAVSSASYTPTARRLLPLDRAWLAEREAAPWPTRQLPAFRMEWDALFAALVRQYLFVSLYRAFAESLAGEHASRLAAMQRAETNVEDRLDMLEQTYHRRRQRAITEEVLDITAGFEALRTDSRREAAETVSEDAGW